MRVPTAALARPGAVCRKLHCLCEQRPRSRLVLPTFNSHLECTEIPQALHVFPCLLRPQIDDCGYGRAVEEARRMH